MTAWGKNKTGDPFLVGGNEKKTRLAGKVRGRDHPSGGVFGPILG